MQVEKKIKTLKRKISILLYLYFFIKSIFQLRNNIENALDAILFTNKFHSLKHH